MKPKTKRDLSYTDPLTVGFSQNSGTSSISVIQLTNGWKEGQNRREFNTSLAEVIQIFGITAILGYVGITFTHVIQLGGRVPTATLSEIGHCHR